MCRLLLAALLSCGTATAVRAQPLTIPERLSLEEALRLAEERSPALAAARSGVDIASADRIAARLRPNPAATVESSNYPLFEPSRPAFVDNQELTVRIDQELELAGRRGLRVAAAEAGVASATATLDDRVRQLQLDVRRTYYRIVLAKADLDVSQAALAEVDRVIALNRARYEQGEISGAEVRRTQVERLRFVDDVFKAQLDLRNARSSLLALLNAPDMGAIFDVTESLAGSAEDGTRPPAALQPNDVTSLRAAALALRPDLIAAQRNIQRAETETRLQRALRTPNITIGGGYRRNFGANAFVAAVTVPLPLFNQNQGGVARADAERRQAENLAAVTRTAVLLDLQQALNAVDVSKQRVDYIEREYLGPAREARDIVLAAYQLGTADLIDYLDAQRAFRDTRRTYNAALYERHLSQFQLAAATGAPATR